MNAMIKIERRAIDTQRAFIETMAGLPAIRKEPWYKIRKCNVYYWTMKFHVDTGNAVRISTQTWSN